MNQTYEFEVPLRVFTKDSRHANVYTTVSISFADDREMTDRVVFPDDKATVCVEHVNTVTLGPRAAQRLRKLICETGIKTIAATTTTIDDMETGFKFSSVIKFIIAVFNKVNKK